MAAKPSDVLGRELRVLAQQRNSRRNLKVASHLRQALCIQFAVLNMVVAILPVEAALRGVQIQGAPLDILYRIDIARSRVDDRHCFLADSPVGVVPNSNIDQRIHERICDEACKVAGIVGTEQWQHEIRTVADTPYAECLAEIRAVIRNARWCGDIDEAAQP